MHRRQLLKLGWGATAVIAAAGGAAAWMAGQQTRQDARFDPAARQLWLAVGAAVLAGVLPTHAEARAQTLNDWLSRLEDTVAGLPAAVQHELDRVILILQTTPGRLAFVGLMEPWGTATPPQVQAALQGLRLSTLVVRQQVFHALRDLSNAAYFASPQTWTAIGYPEPLKV
jgi:hypothetical protein